MERDFAHLTGLIETECQAIERLIAVLLEEREALSGRDMEVLVRVTGEKVTILDAVDACAATRNAWALEHGIAPEDRPFSRFVAEAAEAHGQASLLESWQKLRDTLHTAHRENLVNGRIIARSRQTLSHLLHVLRGQVDSPALYSRGGTTRTGNDSGEIARA